MGAIVPLPLREGLGVGARVCALKRRTVIATRDFVAIEATQSQPTPGPSLKGRGGEVI